MQGFGCFEADDRGRLCYRPSIPPFPRLDDVYGAVQRAERAVEEFDRALSAFPVADVVGKLFARLDAVHSSGAEGATTTFTDLLAYQTSLRRAKDVEDARDVEAIAEAFDSQSAESDLLFTESALAIHRRLFERTADPMAAAGAGRLKDHPNGTYDPEFPGGIFYYTRPASIPPVLQEWNALTAASDERPELVRQALSHWMFEHIHPMADGNGRVGRLLVPLALRRKGVLHQPCAFLGEAVHLNKDIYVDALKDGRRRGDFAAWTRVFCSLIEQTALSNADRLESLGRVHAGWLAAVRPVRSHSIVHQLVPWVLARPTFTVRDALDVFAGAVTFAAMNSGIKRLEALGIVQEVGPAAKERLFSAPEVIALFDPQR